MTTTLSFLINASSEFPAIQSFGIFSAAVVRGLNELLSICRSEDKDHYSFVPCRECQLDIQNEVLHSSLPEMHTSYEGAFGGPVRLCHDSHMIENHALWRSVKPPWLRPVPRITVHQSAGDFPRLDVPGLHWAVVRVRRYSTQGFFGRHDFPGFTYNGFLGPL